MQTEKYKNIMWRCLDRKMDRCEDDETNKMCRCWAQVEYMDANAKAKINKSNVNMW